MKKKNVVLVVLLLLISHGVFFIFGSVRGSNARGLQLERAVADANAQVLLAHYSNYRDIALAIKARKYNDATCRAEMSATSMLEELEVCATSKACQEGIKNSANKFAPEVLRMSEVPIERRYKCTLENK